jgi:CheY-like chemotaxis protein
LLSNAFKYTNEGRVDWFVACEREGDDVWFTARVADTGVGIRPEDIKKLFSDYNQLDTASNRKIEGTGLGLSITKMMVEMMDGTITVESEYGKGSVFTARIRQGFVTDVPIGKDVAESLKRFQYSDSRRRRNAKVARVQLPHTKILVVDDVQTNLDVAKGMMKPYGMHVDCVTSGCQAIHRIQEAKVLYDAIFMDHMMPEMDGIEATRIIRGEIGTEYAKNIPIIALTANAIIGSEKIFLENGFQAFISKPIDVTRLDAVIRRWLWNGAPEKERPAEEDGAGANANANANAKNSGENFATLNIDGLDAKKCLERFGDETTVWQVLRSYAVNTAPLLGKVREVTEEALPEYAVVVHGIKGSSRGICAESVGNMAESLEYAASAGNMAFIKENNGSFIEAAEKLLDALRAALCSVERKKEGEQGKTLKDAPDGALLEKLAERCENYDMDGIDGVMAELESFDYAARADLIAWLRERVEKMEFAEIRNRLSSAVA